MRFSALMFAARLRLRMDARTVLAELRELLLMSALLLCQAGDDQFCGGRSASANADRQHVAACYRAILLLLFCCFVRACVCAMLAFVVPPISNVLQNSTLAPVSRTRTWMVHRRNKPLSVPPGRCARC